MNLTELFLKYGHTDKVTGHSYGESYEKWFERFRDKPINFLELGVCWFGGGSVMAFADYFLKAQIWGVDWECGKCMRAVFNHARISVMKGDVTSQELFDALKVRKYEIIIHDCRHLSHWQAEDTLRYFPLLTDDGVFVIEDVRRPHVDRLLQGLSPLKDVSIEVFDLKAQRKDRKMDDNILVKIEHAVR